MSSDRQRINKAPTLCIALAIGVVGLAQGQAITYSGLSLRGLVTSQFSESANSRSPLAQISGGSSPILLREDGSVYSCSRLPGGVVPRNVPPLKTFVAVNNVGGGIGFDGRIYTWGQSPFDIRPPESIFYSDSIDTDGTHFVAYRDSTEIVCWGNNEFGQCDIRPTGEGPVVKAIATPHRTILLNANGTISQVSRLNPLPRSDTPLGEPVTEPSDFCDISADGERFLAIRKDGSGTYFGFPSDWRPGDPWPIRRIARQQGIRALVPHNVGTAILWNGKLIRLARNDTWVDLGLPPVRSAFGSKPWVVGLDGTVTGPATTFGPIVPEGNIVSLTGSIDPHFPQLSDGVAGYGLLQSGKAFSFPLGLIVPGPTTYTALAAGTNHAFGLDTGGFVSVLPPNSNPQPPTGLKQVKQISASEVVGLAVTQRGKVVAWPNSPDYVGWVPKDLPAAKAVAAGRNLNVALLEDGHVRIWGNGGFESTMGGLADVTKVAATDDSAVALTAGGKVTVDPEIADVTWSSLSGVTNIYASGDTVATQDATGKWTIRTGPHLGLEPFAAAVIAKLMLNQTTDSLMVGVPSFKIEIDRAEGQPGSAVQATASLVEPAPIGGKTLALAGSDTRVLVPSSITVPAGRRTVSFPIKVGSTIVSPTPVIVTATVDGQTQRAQFLVQHAFRVFAPTVTVGGSTTPFEVTIRAPRVQAKDTAYQVFTRSIIGTPGIVVIPAGANSVTFRCPVSPVSSVSFEAISIRSGSAREVASVTVLPFDVIRLEAEPRIHAGQTVPIKVTLNAAPLFEKTMMFQSSAPEVLPNLTAIFGVGSDSSTVSVIAEAVEAQSTAHYIDSFNQPVGPNFEVAGASISVTSAYAGQTATAELRLAGWEADHDITFQLTPTDSYLNVPRGVTIPKGSSSVVFNVGILEGAPTTESFLAQTDHLRCTGRLSVSQPTLVSILTDPGSVVGGSNTEATVQLKVKPNPAIPIRVSLSSSSSLVTLPDYVVIPPGNPTKIVKVTGKIEHRQTRAKQTAILRATLGTTTVSTRLVVLP